MFIYQFKQSGYYSKGKIYTLMLTDKQTAKKMKQDVMQAAGWSPTGDSANYTWTKNGINVQWSWNTIRFFIPSKQKGSYAKEIVYDFKWLPLVLFQTYERRGIEYLLG